MARRLSESDIQTGRARKHSSGDLHSRLKTRKLLGVGETDDGDVHRSKLSQILGHSEQLYVKLPKGLRIWQVTTAFMFTFVGLWALFFPRHLFSFALTSEAENYVILPIRLYGTALISLSLVFWHTTQSMDKDVIRWSLLGSATYFTLQFIVTSYSLWELGELTSQGPRILSHRVIFTLISVTYYLLLSGHTLRSLCPFTSSQHKPGKPRTDDTANSATTSDEATKDKNA